MSYSPSEVVVFRVIGERADDPRHLLLASPDGCWYDYDIDHGTVVPVAPADSWNIDMQDGTEVHLWTASPRIVA